MFGLINGEEIWGNFIFFIISGFLIAAPWKDDAEKAYTSISYVARFYFKRCWALMPMYIAGTLFHTIAYPNFRVSDNLLMINPQLTAWFLEQMLIIYLIVPPMMFAFHLLKRYANFSNAAIAVIPVVLAILSAFPRFCPYVVAGDIWEPVRLYVFFYGAALGYLLKTNALKKAIQNKIIVWTINCFAVLSVILIFCGTTRFFINWTQADLIMSWVTLLIILAAYISPIGSLFRKVLSFRPITFIGRKSLGIMMLHIPLHEIIPFSGLLHFILVFLSALALTAAFDKLMSLLSPTEYVTAWLSEKKSSRRRAMVVFACVAVYISSCFAVAHYRAYHYGANIGLNAFDATGLYNARGLKSILADGSLLKEDTLFLDLTIREDENRELLFDLTGEFPQKGVEFFAEGLPMVDIREETGYISAVIPASLCVDHRLNIECRFPEATASEVLLQNAKVSERQDYILDTELSFKKSEESANSQFVSGLRPAEENATWAKEAAQARFSIPAEAVGKALMLHLEWAAVDSHAQRMIVTCSGQEILNHLFLEETQINVPIPASQNADSILRLSFYFPDACPSSFAFTSMKISEDIAKGYEPGTHLFFTESNPTAKVYFLTGLGSLEPTATWAKDYALAQFGLPDSTVGKELLLHLEWAAVDSHAQTMIVRCSGRELLRQTFLTETEVDVIIPASWNTEETLQLDFEFPDACPSSFAFTEMCISEA